MSKKEQLARVRSLAIAQGADPEELTDEQLVLQFKHLANLNEQEAQLSEDEVVVAKLKAEIDRLQAINKENTSHCVRQIMENDSLSKKLAIAEAANSKNATASIEDAICNSLVKQRLEKGMVDDEHEVFDELLRDAKQSSAAWTMSDECKALNGKQMVANLKKGNA